jgi:hypothetical protein
VDPVTRQSLRDIIAHYEKPDPWGYKTSAADVMRKSRILNACRAAAGSRQMFSRALDIACGEGWITGELPAHAIHGYELAEEARKRFPAHVYPLSPELLSAADETPLKYPLVVCTGALYEHYDWEHFVDLIERHASDTIVTCSVAHWEHAPAIERISKLARKYHVTEFPYNRTDLACMQTLRVFYK